MSPNQYQLLIDIYKNSEVVLLIFIFFEKRLIIRVTIICIMHVIIASALNILKDPMLPIILNI